jgi:hypothetical protein
MSALFIAIGLSASIPLMLTMVQKGFYFVPSLPFFAIGLSILIAPILINFIKKIDTATKKYRIFLLFSILLFFSTITFSIMQIGKSIRDKDILHDVYLIGKVVPKYTTIDIPDKIWNNWSLHCYFMRYFNISLNPYNKNKFYIIEKSMSADTLLNFEKINIFINDHSKYDLFKSSV